MNDTMTKELIAQHGLSEDEYKRIVEVLGREPNLVELGMFSVMWSEHCSYKSSRVHLKKLPTAGPRVVQGPGENAGAVDIGDGLVAVFKIESHNHPSFIEAYQGAATGVGGILRDIFTMGARPIALLDSLRFGSLERPLNRHLFKGVVAGIAGYGNCLAARERILVKTNGQIVDLRFEDIGQRCFAQEEFGVRKLDAGALEVLSFDPCSGSSCWIAVRKVFKMRSSQLVRVKTALGRVFLVTPDHPTVVHKDSEFVVTQASDLKVGDEIPLLGPLPTRQENTKEIDLIEIFKARSENIYVRLPLNVEVSPDKIMDLVASPSNRHRYRARRTMPLKTFLDLESRVKLPRARTQLFIPSGKANYIPSVLRVTKDLARLMGYYLSEGCVSLNGTTYRLIWTFGKHEHEYADDVCRILKRLKIRYSVYLRKSTIAIVVTSWFLGILFKDVWKAGVSSTEKSVPSIFLAGSRELKVEVLKGLLRGDGSVSFYPSGSRVKVRFGTSSERLCNQVVMMLQDITLFPYVYRTRQTVSCIEGREVQAGSDLFQLEFNNYSDISRLCGWFSKGINGRMREALAAYTHRGRRFSYPRAKSHGTFSTVQVREISRVDNNDAVYDLEVDTPHLFVTTSGVITHNCVGVPTVGGEVVFNDIYDKNPLVNVFCLGIAEKEKLFRGVATGVGNPVIYVGSKTGRDGIHGATMASDVFDDESASKRPTVQVGDPFTEKLLLEACLELMDRDLLIGIQDMGAAGLTSSSCEMASRSGTGIELDLTPVPRREEGMTPYEVLLSESQERMLMVAQRGREDDVLAICRKWDLDAAIVGQVTGDGLLRVRDRGVIVAEVPARALAEDAPRYERPDAPPAFQEHLQGLNLDALRDVKDPTQDLLALLESPTIADKSWVYQQYDHMVRTNSVVRPGSDAAVVRIKGTNKALALTTDGNGRYCLLNPYVGGTIAVAEAARNLVCSGAEPIGLTNCLNFGNPERPEIMWQLSLCIEGIKDACATLGIPVVSGNVSLYNETNGLSIYPTPVIGMVGLIESLDQVTTSWFEREGDDILLVGQTGEDLGGTEYLRVVHSREQGAPPLLDVEREKAVQAFVLTLIRNGLVSSAHDCAEGGLAVALAECCLSRVGDTVGAVVQLSPDGLRRDAVLFGESQSRIVLSARPQDRLRILRLAEEARIPIAVIGTVGGDRLVVELAADRWGPGCRIDVDLKTLEDRWRYGLKRSLGEG